MENRKKVIMENRLNIGLCAVALAVVILGVCLKCGMDNFTFRDRTISARGVAEREVMANIGNGIINISLEDNSSVSLKNRLVEQVEEIKAFVEQQGIPDSCITVNVPEIYRNSLDYQGRAPQYDYSGTSGLSIYTSEVIKLDSLKNNVYMLIDKGILASCYTSYEYSKLNDIKPDMISEATHNARVAADRFAKDSGSEIGLIKSANQGYFSIDDIDGKPRYHKKARVVTSVEFYLND